nr:lanC-like protein GCL2 [Ipomoea batatas]
MGGGVEQPCVPLNTRPVRGCRKTSNEATAGYRPIRDASGYRASITPELTKVLDGGRVKVYWAWPQHMGQIWDYLMKYYRIESYARVITERCDMPAANFKVDLFIQGLTASHRRDLSFAVDLLGHEFLYGRAGVFVGMFSVFLNKNLLVRHCVLFSHEGKAKRGIKSGRKLSKLGKLKSRDVIEWQGKQDYWGASTGACRKNHVFALMGRLYWISEEFVQAAVDAGEAGGKMRFTEAVGYSPWHQGGKMLICVFFTVYTVYSERGNTCIGKGTFACFTAMNRASYTLFRRHYAPG